MELLAKCYEQGLGVAVDAAQAKAWRAKAEEARAKLREFMQKMSPTAATQRAAGSASVSGGRGSASSQGSEGGKR